MSRRLLVAAMLIFACVSPWSASKAQAQERMPYLDLSTAVSNAVVPPVLLSPESLPSLTPSKARSRSSSLLAGLYVSTAVMQALDVHSTLTAFQAGAVEANPLMTEVTKNKVAFIALKAGIATSTMLAAHNMAKTNKVAAIATLFAINSAYAMIVEHNYKVANSLR
jgi:hypothetical protein